jgi:hypothetical protein
MLALFLALLMPLSEPPAGVVDTGPIEAVYLPAAWSGPIVAAPFSERAFE